MKRILFLTIVLFLSLPVWAQNALVFQSDFGTKDGAVAAMKGVAAGVSLQLHIHGSDPRDSHL